MEVLQDTYKDTIFRRLLGNIPKDWNIKEISDFTKFSQGVQVNVELQSSLPSNELIRFIRIVDYTQSTDDIRYVSKSYKKYIVNENDIVMIRYGTPGIIGRNIKGVIANNMFKISIDNSLASNDYFEYFFKQKHIQEYLLMGSGSSTMPALNFSYLKKFQVALPPLQEQQKIAAILSTVDEQISITDKIIEMSKELKKGLMQKLFSEGIGHTEFKDTKVGRIPKDWQVIQLGELCEVITKGTTPTTNGFPYLKTGINFVKVESINAFGRFIKEKFAFVGEDCYKSFKRSQLKEGDILISIAGALGRTAIVTENILPANTNQAVGILRLKDKSLNNFIRYFLDSYSLQKFIERINVASAQANLNLGHLNKFNIPFPAINEQQKIVAILSEADAKIEKEQEQKTKLEQLKKGLMQQLLTGRKRVKV